MGVVGGKHFCGGWSGRGKGECRWGSSEQAPLLASLCLLGPLGLWSAEVTRLSCPAGLPTHFHSLSSCFSPDPPLAILFLSLPRVGL